MDSVSIRSWPRCPRAAMGRLPHRAEFRGDQTALHDGRGIWQCTGRGMSCCFLVLKLKDKSPGSVLTCLLVKRDPRPLGSSAVQNSECIGEPRRSYRLRHTVAEQPSKPPRCLPGELFAKHWRIRCRQATRWHPAEPAYKCLLRPFDRWRLRSAFSTRTEPKSLQRRSWRGQRKLSICTAPCGSPIFRVWPAFGFGRRW